MSFAVPRRHLVAKMADLLGHDYDWSAEAATIEAPTLLVFGDADTVRPHTSMSSRANVTLTALAIAAGSVMFSAPTASAAAYCSSSGYTATNEPMERCTTLSNGILYNKQTSGTTVYATYSKTGGSTISVRLGYTYSGSTTYSSSFSISSGQTVQKSWGLGSSAYCKSMAGVLTYSGGTFQTPSTHC
ncbi:hypothetical protein GCM10020367_50090 [Streptomyces sannanensis]|uniref:Uncharacterized protein n=1 Tax=Streptomyces sannanensis TaxID=285536 RepID=A0ABP6SHP6_9ACTN